MNLRVMTYNIQHGKVHLAEPKCIDLNVTCAVIREESPDILVLNEVYGAGDLANFTGQAEQMAAALGMHAYFGRSIYVGGCGPYGNAVLSKYPILEARVIRIPDPIFTDPAEAAATYVEPRTVTRCVVELPAGKTLAVYGSHFGLSEKEGQNAAALVTTLLRDETLPFVFMGDLNMTPDHPFLAPLFASIENTDRFLAGGKTYPSDNPTEKIDYIFLGGCAHAADAHIRPVVASDHFPVIADITVG